MPVRECGRTITRYVLTTIIIPVLLLLFGEYLGNRNQQSMYLFRQWVICDEIPVLECGKRLAPLGGRSASNGRAHRAKVLSPVCERHRRGAAGAATRRCLWSLRPHRPGHRWCCRCSCCSRNSSAWNCRCNPPLYTSIINRLVDSVTKSSIPVGVSSGSNSFLINKSIFFNLNQIKLNFWL